MALPPACELPAPRGPGPGPRPHRKAGSQTGGSSAAVWKTALAGRGWKHFKTGSGWFHVAFDPVSFNCFNALGMKRSPRIRQSPVRKLRPESQSQLRKETQKAELGLAQRNKAGRPPGSGNTGGARGFLLQFSRRRPALPRGGTAQGRAPGRCTPGPPDTAAPCCQHEATHASR